MSRKIFDDIGFNLFSIKFLSMSERLVKCNYRFSAIKDLMETREFFDEINRQIDKNDSFKIALQDEDLLWLIQKLQEQAGNGGKENAIIAENKRLQEKLVYTEDLLTQQAAEYKIAKERHEKAVRSEIEELKKKISKQSDFLAKKNEEITKYKNKIEEQQEVVIAKNKEIEELKAKLQSIIAPQTPESQIDPDEVKPLKPDNENLFLIRTTCSPLSEEKVTEFMKAVQNTSGVDRVFVKFPDSKYEKIWLRFKMDLTKRIKDISKDDDMETIATDILKPVDVHIINKMLIALYRGQCSKQENRNSMEYELLKELNAYLSACGFYAKEFRPGEQLTDDELLLVDPIYVDGKTEIQTNSEFSPMKLNLSDISDGNGKMFRSGTILEIILYPYFLDYIDEDGEVQHAQTEGKLVIAK